MPAKIGRPTTGIKVDFRIPADVKRSIEEEADFLGIPHDQHYRNILVAGWVAVGTRDRVQVHA